MFTPTHKYLNIISYTLSVGHFLNHWLNLVEHQPMLTLHVHPIPGSQGRTEYINELWQDGIYMGWHSLSSRCLEHAEAEAVQQHPLAVSVNEILLVNPYGDDYHAESV